MLRAARSKKSFVYILSLDISAYTLIFLWKGILHDKFTTIY